MGISADGQTVVGVGTGSSGPEAFRWTASGGMIGLGDLPGGDFESVANSVSADGTVIVGGATDATGELAFRWTLATGMTSLGDLPGGATFSVANDVSDNGIAIVGRSTGANGIEAFRWTDSGGMVGLGTVPGGTLSSEANGVSQDGSVVTGYAFLDGVEHGFLWTQAGGTELLATLPSNGFNSNHPLNISADGTTVVGWGFAASQPFRWTEATGLVKLGTLSDPFGFPHGVSADGSIIVGTGINQGGDSEAFIWDAIHGVRSLPEVLIDRGVDLTGWQLFGAFDVSADGETIVGLGRNPAGNQEAWIVELPVPEPETAILLMGSLIAVWRVRRHCPGDLDVAAWNGR